MSFLSVAVRILLAVVVGGLLGLERERRSSPAGFRTYMLVAIGSSMTIMLSQYIDLMLSTQWAATAQSVGATHDVSRFGAQVINGIGFLGAGTILVTGRQEVKGLTTAAGLWASACMGLAIGAGFYECVVLCTVLIFLCMRFLPAFENYLVEKVRFINIYVEFRSLDDLGSIISRIKSQGARICDVDINRGRTERSINPNAVFAIRLQQKQPHTQVLTAIAALDSVYTIDEV